MTGIGVTWDQASARRLLRAGLAVPLSGEAATGEATAREAATDAVTATVGAMAGAHAQVMSAAEVSVAIRTDGAVGADVRAALWETRSLVKTYGPRGTVHLLPTADLPAWLGALSALPGNPNRHADGVRLSTEQETAVVDAVGAALADGDTLTAEELDLAVTERCGAWAADLVMPAFQGFWPRWRQAISVAAHRGALSFGPNRGRKTTYTSPGVTPLAAEAGLAFVVRSYLTAYGPATPAHFAKWLGGTATWAAKVFDDLGDAVTPVTFEGAPAYVAAGDTEFPDASPRGVRLLPYFDAYGVAGQPRDLLFPGRAAERALNRGQAGNFPLLLVDGVVAGVWHQKKSGRKTAVTVETLADLGDDQLTELYAQVDRIGEIVDARPALTVGPVTAGPHA
ncbi:winged helix DNA-binding domain-containing protein [Catenulispora yoronensis]|uniref:Winged helix DNA-binding domain-containing protein n=1 Tax=Catenulispora yoronensis TaxID=450799 RepID=A0ABN2VC85_9ACTN